MKGATMEHADNIVAAALRRAGLNADSRGRRQVVLADAVSAGRLRWVELMRLRPGVRLGLHRHTGEVHALNLAGERRLNDGRLVRAGDYVYEPPGNVRVCSHAS
jgi:2,4'-dihydroxyacetophenone dioxygenase